MTTAVRVDLGAYLADCRALVIEEIRRLVSDAGTSRFYELMLDYPLRAAKGLRPALCIATTRALGGGCEAALPSAAALELYHNAFLIHDDIEDGSEHRRSRETLHRLHGVPIAINVGDGMLALALTPLLENTRVVGLGKALRIAEVIARMARETAEGQAIELDWVHGQQSQPTDDDYREMVVKKTGWYSFMTPMMVGAIIGGADEERTNILIEAARELAIAFQIKDDLLNLERAAGGAYGKEALGDLWEGKRTLILVHMLRSLGDEERGRAHTILGRPRAPRLAATLDELACSGDLSPAGRARLEALFGSAPGKTADDVGTLMRWIERSGSMPYAAAVGRAHAVAARTALERAQLSPSLHRDVIEALIEFTIERMH